MPAAGHQLAEIGQLIGTSKRRCSNGSEARPPAGRRSNCRRDDRPPRHGVQRDADARGQPKALRLVATGALTLVLRQTDTAWEHIRVSGFRPADVRARMEQDGWTFVSSWYPFHYFKRPVGLYG
jgi:hypothetical protein